MATATKAAKHDLALRKIPLSRLIYRAAFEQNLEPIAIRQNLQTVLGISRERLSQMENIQAEEPVSIRKIHVDAINAFFTELLKEEVRVEATAPVGLFATAA